MNATEINAVLAGLLANIRMLTEERDEAESRHQVLVELANEEADALEVLILKHGVAIDALTKGCDDAIALRVKDRDNAMNAWSTLAKERSSFLSSMASLGDKIANRESAIAVLKADISNLDCTINDLNAVARGLRVDLVASGKKITVLVQERDQSKKEISLLHAKAFEKGQETAASLLQCHKDIHDLSEILALRKSREEKEAELAVRILLNQPEIEGSPINWSPVLALSCYAQRLARELDLATAAFDKVNNQLRAKNGLPPTKEGDGVSYDPSKSLRVNAPENAKESKPKADLSAFSGLLIPNQPIDVPGGPKIMPLPPAGRVSFGRSFGPKVGNLLDSLRIDKPIMSPAEHLRILGLATVNSSDPPLAGDRSLEGLPANPNAVLPLAPLQISPGLEKYAASNLTDSLDTLTAKRNALTLKAVGVKSAKKNALGPQ